MERNKYNNRKSWSYAAKLGFRDGILLTYGYSIAFIFYAILRSSWIISHQLTPSEGLWPTLFGNALSITLSSLSIATVIMPGPVMIGMITSLLIKWVMTKSGSNTPSKIASIGLVSSLIITSILHIMLFKIVGTSWVGSSPGSYWFWFGLPAIIYVAAGYNWAAQISQQSATGETEVHEVKFLSAPKNRFSA